MRGVPLGQACHETGKMNVNAGKKLPICEKGLNLLKCLAIGFSVHDIVPASQVVPSCNKLCL